MGVCIRGLVWSLSALLLALAPSASAVVKESSGNGTAPPPTLRLLGVKSDEITLTAPKASFYHRFLIESTSQVAVSSLRVEVLPLQTSAGETVTPKVTVGGRPAEQGSPLAVGKNLILELSAELSTATEYRSFLTLYFDGQSLSYPLAITRGDALPAVEIHTLATVANGANPQLRVTVEGKRLAQIKAPQLQELNRRQADDSLYQARWCNLEVVEPQEPGPWSLSGEGQTREFLLAIKGLHEPGSYRGKLRVNTVGGKAAEQEFTVLVRRGWCVAAFWIFLGVATSFLLNTWGKTLRPRLVRKRRIHLLLGDLERVAAEQPELRPEEAVVRDLLRLRLSHLLEELEMSLGSDFDEQLDRFDEKLTLFPEWVNTRRRIEGLEPPGLRALFKNTLAAARDALSNQSATKEQISKATEGLRNLGDQIGKELKNLLKAEIASFEEDVIKFKGTIEALAQVEVEAEVLAPLKAALGALTGGEVASARRTFDGARRNYAQLLARRLEARLPEQPPEGFEQQEWEKVVAAVRQGITKAWNAADPETAIRAYQETYRAYFRQLCRALRKAVRDTRATVLASEAGQQDERLMEVQSIEDLIARALSRAEANSLREADEDYAEAKQRNQTLRSKVPGLGMMGGAGKAPVALLSGATFPPVSAETEVVGGPSRALQGRPAAIALTRLITKVEWIVSVAAVLVAVLLGWKLLWASNPTWGSLDDIATAVLWGLGLHQVSGTAFQGVLGLRDKLTGGTG